MQGNTAACGSQVKLGNKMGFPVKGIKKKNKKSTCPKLSQCCNSCVLGSVLP